MSTSSFRAVPLGGLGRIGGNMMVYETESDLIVVDCGVNFPGPDEPGVEWLVPDISYLLERRDKLRGYVITHGHEDHVGALPFVHPQVPAPVYGTAFTLSIARRKLAERELAAQMHEIRDGVPFVVGEFELIPVPVTHSIPGAVALGIQTPVGTIVHTGDFKIDPHPSDGRHFGTEPLRQLGDRGVVALFSDSTNATREGHTRSERVVADALRPLIAQATGRVLVTTFSSNLYRLQTIVEAACAAGRQVVTVGRSVNQFIDLGLEHGMITAPDGTFRELAEFSRIPRDRVVIIASGCQGESYSAFGRISAGEHSMVHVGAGDTVIMSARRIPGNERTIGRAVNRLLARGVEVLDPGKYPEVHASGHGCRDEQREMIELCRPRIFIPLHGELRHMRAHATLGRAAGAEVHVLEDGEPVELVRDGEQISLNLLEPVKAGFQMMDGSAAVPSIVLRDRQILGTVGFVSCAVVVDDAARLASTPFIATRGVIWVDESPELMEKAVEAVENAIDTLSDDDDDDTIAEAVRLALRRLFKRELSRRPLILPMVMRVDDD